MIRKLEYDEIFKRQPTLDEVRRLDRYPISALIENIRSMHNVGSIFRSSDGVRLQKLFLTGFTACPPRKEIDKTALGSTDSVPWEFSRDPLPIIEKLKNENCRIVVLEHTDKSIPYFAFDYQFPICLVAGNEVEGVSKNIIKQADAAIDIPMLGLKQSLNVSVAFGVVIYHILCEYLNTKAVNP